MCTNLMNFISVHRTQKIIVKITLNKLINDHEIISTNTLSINSSDHTNQVRLNY